MITFRHPLKNNHNLFNELQIPILFFFGIVLALKTLNQLVNKLKGIKKWKKMKKKV
jgi:hypothetical protein